MISTRSKWLFGGFALAPISYAILMFYSFRMLHQVQSEQVKHGTLPPPDVLVHSMPLQLVPALFIGMIAGCIFALLALVSLAFDFRTSGTELEVGNHQANIH